MTTDGIASAIDLGTNTILMATGHLDAEGTLQILDDAHAIARLGRGVDAAGVIQDETAARVCGLLLSYRERARSFGANTIRAFGTSALRDSANKEAFVARVWRETGIELTEISGHVEARLTFAGAAFGLDLPRCYAVLDIGGGSTELAAGCGDALTASASVDIGAVRVTERCFPELPPTAAAIEKATHMIEQAFEGLFELPTACDAIVGVAGTVTTLGALDAGIERFDAEELNGHYLDRDRVADLAATLMARSLEEIISIPQVTEQRADIISAGALILRTFFDRYPFAGMTVSTRGIRYALLNKMLSEADGV
jgi:exopolyphosphatase/guanosine-5'-triphosphate,3'-diphosphate pyrophosphatase